MFWANLPSTTASIFESSATFGCSVVAYEFLKFLTGTQRILSGDLEYSHRKATGIALSLTIDAAHPC